MKIKGADNEKKSYIHHGFSSGDSKGKYRLIIHNTYAVNGLLEISLKISFSHLEYLYSPF